MWFEIFKFEIKYRVSKIETYLFFLIILLFSLVAFDFIFAGQDLGQIRENSPHAIAKTMTVVSGFFMLIASLVMGTPVFRDYEHLMDPILFVTPISKRDYLLGRFAGSLVILILIYSALVWGMVLGELMPWRGREQLLPFNLMSYLLPFIQLVIPTLIVGGALFFVSGTLSKKMLVVYTQGLVFFMVTIISLSIENESVSALIEPFAFAAVGEVTKHWTVEEINYSQIPLEGLLLYNRLLWLGVGVLVLCFGYIRFQFQARSKKSYLKENTDEVLNTERVSMPILNDFVFKVSWKTSLNQLLAHSVFHFRLILKEPSFWAIIICAAATIFVNSINLGTIYGADSLPTTYLIVDELKELSIWFFLIILIFYAGEIVWKEKAVGIDTVADALPVSDLVNLGGKFIGLQFVYLILLVALMGSGILFQTVHGYFNYDLKVYITSLFLETYPFLMLNTFVIFFLQISSQSKFTGYALTLLFLLVTVSLEILGFSHGLIKFGGKPLQTYSEMNGYGHFLKPYLLNKAYWIAFGLMLFQVAVLLNVRGLKTSLISRILAIPYKINRSMIFLGGSACMLFLSAGCVYFYNTNVLNRYFSAGEKEAFRWSYEKNLKKFEYLNQPKVTAVNLQVDLFPTKRNYTVEGCYLLENQSDKEISQIHIQKYISDDVVLKQISFGRNYTVDSTYTEFGYFICLLDKPLMPGEAIKMTFRQEVISEGFESGRGDHYLVENGTFFKNDRFPTLGYNRKYELDDPQIREEYTLPVRLQKAERDHPEELKNGQTGGDSYGIVFEMIVSTDADQVAVAPGNLIGEWQENDRKYFHYKMPELMVNFYSIVSARYEVLKDQWVSNGVSNPRRDTISKVVSLEIYHHPGHSLTTDRMMNAMKKSLDYYTQHFGKYPYEQLRIMEYPRYTDIVQSFPGTIPFSEALGFMLDIDDQQDVDIPFFITAHEVAHQWWGLQLMASNVQGKHLILEALSQYSALMVLKHEYPEEKISQFLDDQRERYLNTRKSTSRIEVPLDLVSDESYIYYNKGALNLFALQNIISEDSVNNALNRFLKDWGNIETRLNRERLPTSADLLSYFEEVTPDSLRYLIDDLFREVITFDNEVMETEMIKGEDGKFQLDILIKGNKKQMDGQGNEFEVSMNDWVEISVYSMGDHKEEQLIYLEKHRVKSGENILQIIVEEQPSRVAIDPNNFLIDINPDNNWFELRED